jgi:hypothetical protein
MDNQHYHGDDNYKHDDHAPANDYIVQYDYIIHYDGCSHHIDNRSHCSHYDCTTSSSAAPSADKPTNNNLDYFNNFNNYFDNNNDLNNDHNDSCHYYDCPAHDDDRGSNNNDCFDQHDSTTGTTGTTGTITVTCENGDTYTISDGCHDCGHHHIINYNNNRHI